MSRTWEDFHERDPLSHRQSTCLWAGLLFSRQRRKQCSQLHQPLQTSLDFSTYAKQSRVWSCKAAKATQLLPLECYKQAENMSSEFSSRRKTLSDYHHFAENDEHSNPRVNHKCVCLTVYCWVGIVQFEQVGTYQSAS